MQLNIYAADKKTDNFGGQRIRLSNYMIFLSLQGRCTIGLRKSFVGYTGCRYRRISSKVSLTNHIRPIKPACTYNCTLGALCIVNTTGNVLKFRTLLSSLSVLK